MQKMMRVFLCGLLAASLVAPGTAHAAGGWLPYADIEKHWARPYIIHGVQNGLFVVGEKAPLFYPNREMTRAEFLAMLDRIYSEGQYQLYPLTAMSEYMELYKGEGFAEPYLPYKDVDRMTWMYRPVLRVSVLLDRLYGPGAIQEVFPGEQMNPNQPITQEEAAKLLLMFTMGQDSAYAWEEIGKWGWLDGEREDPLRRGEAAEVAYKLIDYLMQDSIFPLLDYDGSKFPAMPVIEEIFPLFVTYTEDKTPEEQQYVDAVNEIINQYDSRKTYAVLRKLAENGFSNQIGVHYYLSWNPNASLEENLEEAFRAIDAYFADKVILPDTLQLLAANVYDITLQLGAADREQYKLVRERLEKYEQHMKPETKEWDVFSIYIAALEAKSGRETAALKRYAAIALRNPDALLNSAYYLVRQGRIDLAEKMLATVKPRSTDSRLKQLLALLQQEIASLKEQDSIVSDLSDSVRRLEKAETLRISGESMINGMFLHYTQEVDQKRMASRTSGHFQAPHKLLLQKMEGYTDLKNRIQYVYDPESDTWKKHSLRNPDFLHEWVSLQSFHDRLRKLNARYYKQSFGRYDVITEWIPAPDLEAKGKDVRLDHGRLTSAPMFLNKYYIDRQSGQLAGHFWHYEEIYDDGDYLVYAGSQNYEYDAKVNVRKPEALGKEGKR